MAASYGGSGSPKVAVHFPNLGYGPSDDAPCDTEGSDFEFPSEGGWRCSSAPLVDESTTPFCWTGLSNVVIGPIVGLET